ncbi:MAG: hypothetical protein Q9191_006410 [Dirinaria sp. TL-2023a]
MAATPTATMIMGHTKWDPNVCGNTTDNGRQNCGNKTKMLCGGCKLLGKSHWSVHEKDCKADLRTEDALPDFCWDGGAPTDYIFPGAKHIDYPQLWGTSRAVDVLKLQDNEGQQFSEDLMVFFASCNDRDVLKTVNSLSANYQGTLTCLINHESSDVALRNLLILLVATTQDSALAAEVIVHLWYSVFLTRSMIDAMKTSILPLLDANLDFVSREFSEAHRSAGNYYTKWHWQRPAGVNCDIKFGLPWDDLTRLKKLLTTELNKADAVNRRADMIFHPEIHDAKQLCFHNQQPDWRSSVERYEYIGVLSPFGACVKAFDVVNPMMFRPLDTSFIYNQDGFAAPLDGWSIQDLMAFPSGGPRHDLHGQLYFFLRAEVEKFCARIKQGPKIEFIVTRTGACDPHFTHKVVGACYDRIYISKWAMEPYHPANWSAPRSWGLPRMLDEYGQLLKPRSVNPHATLIATFEQYHEKERKTALTKRERQQIMPKLRSYDYVRPASLETPQGLAFKTAIYFAGLLLAPFDELFDEYNAKHHFEAEAAFRGLEMKQQNTIVDKWPARFTKAPGEEGAKKVFRQKLAENAKYEERVVEFKRSDPTTGPQRRSI